MALSANSIETLIDLVEIKLSCMNVCDRDDAREQATLERCLRELVSIQNESKGAGRTRALKAA